MAYMNQERKAAIAPVVKAICKKYGVKASLAVRHHSTLVLNIKSGEIDFIENYINGNPHKMTDEAANRVRENGNIDVNPYWYQEHFTGKALGFMKEIFAAMNNGNHDRSDIQTDYFDVGWYVDVNVGRWNKPYELVA
jgi:hypothetical protein